MPFLARQCMMLGLSSQSTSSRMRFVAVAAVGAEKPIGSPSRQKLTTAAEAPLVIRLPNLNIGTNNPRHHL
jgi:hypothetical protein